MIDISTYSSSILGTFSCQGSSNSQTHLALGNPFVPGPVFFLSPETFFIPRRLIGEAHQNDWTTTSGSWMRRFFQNVLAGETPMSPAEITNLIQSLQIQRYTCIISLHSIARNSIHLMKTELTCRIPVFHSECLDPNIPRPVSHPFQKFAMIARAVGAEVLQNFRKRRVWHVDLEEVVAQWDLDRPPSSASPSQLSMPAKTSPTYHTIIRSALPPKRHRLLADTLIHHPVGEHALIRDAKDERPEIVVIPRLTLLPHACPRQSALLIAPITPPFPTQPTQTKNPERKKKKKTHTP